MAAKRKRGEGNQVIKTPEALRELLSTAITTFDSAEIALLHLMGEYDFSLSHLQQILSGTAILFSPSDADLPVMSPFRGWFDCELFSSQVS
jgi:hypothetical protein